MSLMERADALRAQKVVKAKLEEDLTAAEAEYDAEQERRKKAPVLVSVPPAPVAAVLLPPVESIVANRGVEHDPMVAQKAEQNLVMSDVAMLVRQNLPWNTLIHQAALHYIKSGFFVVPLQKNSKALPDTRYNINYSHASRRKKTIDEWFGPSGKFEGWNVGIACGRIDGVFVVDLDTSEDKNGPDKWAELCVHSAYTVNHLGPVQRTPSGGKHLFFQWFDGGRPTTGKIAKGIDTRGGDEQTCRSHVVAWPSIVGGKQYEWMQGGKPPAVPAFVSKMLPAEENKKPKGKGRGSEDVTDADMLPVVPLPKIAEMLTFVDPSKLTYDDWLRIGMAINSQWPGSDGVDVWDTWSKRDTERYKPGECIDKWHGFDSSRTVTIGTVIFFARNAGWKAAEGDEDADPVGAMVARFNSNYAIVADGSQVWFLRVKEKATTLEGTFALMTKSHFLDWTSDDYTMMRTAKGTKPVLSTKLWLANPGRRKYTGIGIYPNNKGPAEHYNAWEGWAVKPVPGDVTPLLDHLLNVWCQGNQEHYEYLLDWFATAVQNAHQKGEVALVIQGGEGTGKGIVLSTIGKLFGTHFVHATTPEHLIGKFNSTLHSALFCFGDEVTWGGSIKEGNVLKALTTEREVLSEQKFKDAKMVFSLVRLALSTNDKWAVPAGVDSRRWFVLRTQAPDAARLLHQPIDRAYFNRLGKFMGESGPQILHFLLTRQIKTDQRVALHTQWLQEQRDQTAMRTGFARWHALHELSGFESLASGINGTGNERWARRPAFYEDYLQFMNGAGGKGETPLAKTPFYDAMLGAGWRGKDFSAVGRCFVKDFDAEDD